MTHIKTRLEYAYEDLQPEAQSRALADYLPYVDPENMDAFGTFMKACDEHQWKFYSDGTAVRDGGTK